MRGGSASRARGGGLLLGRVWKIGCFGLERECQGV